MKMKSRIPNYIIVVPQQVKLYIYSNSSMSLADQIKCKIHPNEYITNYCSKEGCFVELCATCICEHTEIHNRINTKAEYENIKETYLRTNENLNKFKERLNKQKTRIKNITDSIQKKRKEVQKLFKQAKQDVLNLVQRTFSQLEKQFNDQLTRQKQKTGLLNEGRLDQIYAQINKRSLDVYTTSQQLANLRQPNILKRINTQFLPQGYQFKEEVAQQISLNQLFQPNVVYKSSYLQQVSGAIKRLVSISFSYPVVQPKGNHKLSRTPMKQYKQYNKQQGVGNMSKRDGRDRSPIDVRNNRMGQNIIKMRSTTKQNSWMAEPTIKIFANTFH